MIYPQPNAQVTDEQRKLAYEIWRYLDADLKYSGNADKAFKLLANFEAKVRKESVKRIAELESWQKEAADELFKAGMCVGNLHNRAEQAEARVKELEASFTPNGSLARENNELRIERDKLRAKVEEPRQDKERLDWLEENTTYIGGGNGGTYSFKSPADVEHGLMRVAIDAAIAQQGGGKPA